MAPRWLKIRVDLVRGRGADLESWPGRVMLVPPEATFDDFGLGVDLAFGRWDVTPARSFRVLPRGRHETKRGAAVKRDQAVRDVVGTNDRFEYVFDDDAQWVHECAVEEFAGQRDTKGLAPIAVPVFGWGAIPDQHGRLRPGDDPCDDARDDARAATDADSADLAGEPVDELADAGQADDDADDEAGSTRSERRERDTLVPLEMRDVRESVGVHDATQLLAAIAGRELSPALQQVGDALTRLYRGGGNGPVVQSQLASALRDVEALLGQRAWTGDDVLAEEIAALLTGSERRGRTINVNIGDLADVMSSGGDDPGGYLHLDTGEVVHAFLHHGFDDYDETSLDEAHQPADGVEPADNLWIYVDHDDQGWDDMAAFTKAVPGHYSGILSVAIRGKGAFARFRRTVDDLGLGHDWNVFAEDRRWGRARALLKSQGIRPV